MRNAEVVRQWRILKTLETSRHTTSTALAEEHGVSPRTIRRDLEALQEAGFPVYDEVLSGKRVWRVATEQRVPQSFSLAELAALYFGKNLLSFLGGSPFGPELESAFERIRKALPEKSLPYLARVQDLFGARPGPAKDYSKKRDVIAALVDAILHQRQVKVAYYSFNSRRTKSYDLDPYRLVYWHGGLYLYARAHEYGEVRTFAVERVQRIEVLEAVYRAPADFTLSEYARAAFGIMGGKPERVELRFAPEAAGYIRERVWHESQELAEEPDGSVRLVLQVATGFELRTWIKGLLPHVRVVAPDSLRAELRAEIEQSRRALAD